MQSLSSDTVPQKPSSSPGHWMLHPQIHSAIRIGDPSRKPGEIAMCGCENDSCRCNPQCPCLNHKKCACDGYCHEKDIFCGSECKYVCNTY